MKKITRVRLGDGNIRVGPNEDIPSANHYESGSEIDISVADGLVFISRRHGGKVYTAAVPIDRVSSLEFEPEDAPADNSQPMGARQTTTKGATSNK